MEKNWISIKEQLPDLEQDVLLYDDWKAKEGKVGDIRVGYLSEFVTRKTSEGKTYHCEWRGTEFAFNITHWMPLPSPPKSQGHE